MKTYNLIIIGILLVALTACSPEKVITETAKDEVIEAGRGVALEAKSAAEEKIEKESEELVNFRCTMPDQRTYYFLKGKGKVVSPISTTWLIEDKAYGKMELADGTYLLVNPIEEFGVSYKDMMVAYETSKTVEGMDCERDVVTEEDLALPDFEIITPEQQAEKMLAEMGSVGLS